MEQLSPAIIEDEEEFLDDVQEYMKQRGYVSHTDILRHSADDL